MRSPDKHKVGGSTLLTTNAEHRRSVGILSLGCPRNLVDSEGILGRLNLKRYPIVDINKADIGMVNTCAFIEEAKTESIEAILDLVELKKKGRLKKIIVYGCLTQRYQERLSKELPQVDAFVGRLSFPAKLFKEQAGSRLVSDDWRENHDLERFPLTPEHYAYLKICEGCLNNCSYCVIPKIKGRFTSLRPESILKRVEAFEQKKVISELNIIGQDITGFGMDSYGSTKLAEILGNILKKIKYIQWLRLLYLYPSRVTDELLDLIGSEQKVCKYIDLPIQHINERILGLMRRQTTKKSILELIHKIRKKIPGVAIRTSLIVGFPSERDAEFKELLEFIQEIKFERLGVFMYSREEDTPAYHFKEQIPQKIKVERFQAVMSAQQRISQEVNKRFLGETLEVLIEEKEKDLYLGRTQYDAPEVDGLVYVNCQRALKAGDLVKVKIADTLEYDLVGEAI